MADVVSRREAPDARPGPDSAAAILPVAEREQSPHRVVVGGGANVLEFATRPGHRQVPPRARAAHQEAAHMVRQIERRLRGAPLVPYSYRDFGSLVSLGRWSAVGNLMGFPSGHGLFIEGFFARVMYSSLRLMHERMLHEPGAPC